MKVFASTLAAFAIGQESSDKWTGFDYDYGFGDSTNLQKNQVSQSFAGNTLYGKPMTDTHDSDDHNVNLVDGLQPVFNMHGSQITGADGITYAKMELGNGRMCWFCDSDSVYNCFNHGNFQMCRGQDYFCFYHERRRIGHYFNRREKYIDHHESTNTDLFLVRTNNEAWNLDEHGVPNSKSGGRTHSSISMGSDNLRPATDIHVLAGCQQPEACLRQQSQNQAINMGITFYGDTSTDHEIGNIHGGLDFHTYIHPTSRRNVREGLCRLGKDWTYYSGKLWHYDHQGIKGSGAGSCADPSDMCRVNTIELVNKTRIIPDNATATAEGFALYDSVTDRSAEADAVFSQAAGATVSNLLWGRGIYDAHDTHGHQFWHERESWYNGMRPNGFPENHYHGGKGTESVCHFCCNPTSSDGMFCNRHMLDYTATAKIAQDSSSHSYGLEFANGKGTGNKYPGGVGHLEWMKYDENNSDSADARNAFVDPNYARADDPNLKILKSPMANSYNTEAAWLSKHRYHGMFRNPNSQVSQDFMDPYFA